MTKKAFLHYIHNFRGIAIIFIVAAHMFLFWDIQKEAPFVKIVLDAVWRNGTVLFVFIAGYLFQYLKSKYRYRTYLGKKIKFVILPYLIVSIPVILFRLFVSPPEDVYNAFPNYFEWSLIKKVLVFIVTGTHLLPFWFIPMIFIYYLISPIFVFLDNRPSFYKYILPCLIVLSFFIERGNRGDLHNIHMNFFHFLSIYVFGMWFSHYNDKILSWSVKFKWLVIIPFIVFFLSTIVFYEGIWYDQLQYLQKIFLCWGLFYLLYRKDDVVPVKINKILALFADYSFGIFFIHYLVFLVLRMVSERVYPWFLKGSLVNWIMVFGLTLIISLVVVRLIKLIFPKRSRYLIGC
ncbi:Surface polysaccharide O-acyltransferase, integral membrane enzyme [Marivirga sericea]|uniref:Surface polysaccharide O-acyltransferase, integral membrane enzyme n=1 Tax=Marivirga sericea TaxID=1028 RepID=A0A1X7KL80_9BACT|nr:acyltransferase [Marivirga sericea]SMG41902.1 Surface polysaccharide O-acyltransferase, integral membrane enzyme [Marivirga sericea]